MLDFLGRECGAIINSPDEFVQFIRRYLSAQGFISHLNMNDDHLDTTWILNMVERPSTYPYVAIIHYDDERNILCLYYVTPAVFNTNPKELTQ